MTVIQANAGKATIETSAECAVCPILTRNGNVNLPRYTNAHSLGQITHTLYDIGVERHNM